MTRFMSISGDNAMDRIIFIDGITGEQRVEKVYGGAWIQWAYQSPLGQAIGA